MSLIYLGVINKIHFILLPPIEFHDIHTSGLSHPLRDTHRDVPENHFTEAFVQHAHRGQVEVVEVRVCDENTVDAGKIADCVHRLTVSLVVS